MRHFVGMGFPGGLDKESACNVGDPGLIPGSGRSLEEGNGYHSSLDNLMDSRAPWTGQLQSLGSHRIRHAEQLTFSLCRGSSKVGLLIN